MPNTDELDSKICHGWEISAQGYSNFIAQEFADGTAALWRAELLRALGSATMPDGTPRRVLDVGTGPGLFAILLAQAGCQVTAIDGSPAMLQAARQNAAAQGTHFATQQMQAQTLDFANGAFDAIVNRNVMWTVSDPQRAYAEFLRVLAPGGQLLVYDGDHLADLRDPAIAAAKQAAEEAHRREHGAPVTSFDPDQYEAARGWRVGLPLAQQPRPQWDIAALGTAGFARVQSHYVDEALVPRRGHGGSSQNYAPMFVLSAVKPA